MPGRLILDNIIVAFEAMHSTNTRFCGHIGYMTLKIDMRKTYDRIEWEFLREVMLRLGFNGRFISLVMRCIKLVSYSILINGYPQCSFKPTKGIR